MQWLRLYNDTVTDPKWRVIAGESGQPLSAVLAVWMNMLINASDAEERGTLQGWDDRVCGAALDLRADAVRAIRDAMQGLVLDGLRLSGWDKRQRASDNIAERVKRHRSKAKEAPPDGGSTNGTGGRHKGANGVGNGAGNGDVTLQKRECTEIPLDLSYSSASPTTLNKYGGGDAGAREIRQRVAELSGLPASEKNLRTVEKWLAAGYDAERDIYPAVAAAVPTARDEIGCFEYFSKAIRRHHAARIAPPQAADNVTDIRRAAGRAAGGRSERTQPDAVERLLRREAEERAKFDLRGAL